MADEYLEDFKNFKREKRDDYQQNKVEKDKELLKSLHPKAAVKKIETDGSGGEKYVLEINTDRGFKTVDWWLSTGKWKARLDLLDYVVVACNQWLEVIR